MLIRSILFPTVSLHLPHFSLRLIVDPGPSQYKPFFTHTKSLSNTEDMAKIMISEISAKNDFFSKMLPRQLLVLSQFACVVGEKIAKL